MSVWQIVAVFASFVALGLLVVGLLIWVSERFDRWQNRK